MSNWYALRTSPLKERAVTEILENRGVSALCPTETRWRRDGRKRRIPIERPLLPRYVLMRYDDPWAVVRAMQGRGVCGVVCFDGVPAKIPERSVEMLARRSGAVVNTATRVHRAFAPGDKVEIVSGPYRGWCVELKSIRGEVGKVLVRMFGTEMPAEIRLDQLEAA
jgi:transcription antitermination factor NusG